MFEFHNIKQNEDEWYAMRGGRYTSSNAGKVMASPSAYLIVNAGKDGFALVDTAKKKLLPKRFIAKVEAEQQVRVLSGKDMSKAFGAPAKQYAVDIAIEQLTGKAISSNYTNAHMERGHEQEPLARMAYEDEYFCDVTNGGFFCNDFVGCSPDGLVGDNGVIEIKSVIPSVHYANIKRQSVDPAYKWQCIGNLSHTGREWLDFVSYCADFPVDKQLFVHRLYAENLKEEFAMLDLRLGQFEELVCTTFNLIEESEYAS